MTKDKLIKSILECAKIHHNIRINFNKVPDYTEKDNFSWSNISEYMLDFFKENFENYLETKINDSGNRNLGKKCEIKGEIWTAGRMGATLYWDAYWKSTNHGYLFIYDEYTLKEKNTSELKAILKDIEAFNKMVKGLMTDFYSECEYKLKEAREEKAEEEKQKKEYQEIKKKVIEKSILKRLIAEIF